MLTLKLFENFVGCCIVEYNYGDRLKNRGEFQKKGWV